MTTDIIQQSFGLNLRVMQIFGFYTPNTHKTIYKVMAYVLYFLFIVPVPVLGCLYLLLNKNVGLVEIADNAFLLAEMGCYIIKFLPFINNADKIKKCIHYFESPFFAVRNDNQQIIIDKCVTICKRNTTIFLISVTGGVTSWAIKPFFLKEYKLPTDIWLPFDVEREDKLYYYAVYLFLVIGVAYAAYCSGVIDPLIAGLACQATGHLKVLKNNLSHLEGITDNATYIQIKRCIDYHDAILSFVKEYEDCFSLVVFSQFMGSVFVICVSCLELIMMTPFSFNFFSMIIYLSVMLGEIYLYCYYGSTLYEESNTLTNAVYMGTWYEYDEKSKQALILLMERSKKPMIVTAGKILDLSLSTFTTILRRSYSLLAVLQNYK